MDEKYGPCQIYNQKGVVVRGRLEVSTEEVKTQLNRFFQLYHPAKGQPRHIKQYLTYVRTYGVNNLKIRLKQKYSANFDEIDISERGQLSLQKSIMDFVNCNKSTIFAGVRYGRLDIQQKVKKIEVDIKREGIFPINNQLKTAHGISLLDFQARSITSWKTKWKNSLTFFEQQSLQYELDRYFHVLKAENDKKFESVTWKDEHKNFLQESKTQGRSIINQKLLRRFEKSLDDVPMIKGLIYEDRSANLKLILTNFYHLYREKPTNSPDLDDFFDEVSEINTSKLNRYKTEKSKKRLVSPFKSSDSPQRKRRLPRLKNTPGSKINSRPDSIPKVSQFGTPVGSTMKRTISKGNILHKNISNKVKNNSQSIISRATGTLNRKKQDKTPKLAQFRTPSKDFVDKYQNIVLSQEQLNDIDKYTELGLIQYEELNEILKDKFDADLTTMALDKIKFRIEALYDYLKISAAEESIEEIAKAGLIRGLNYMNENLIIAHGCGIFVTDLISQIS